MHKLYLYYWDATKRYNAVTGEWPAAGADTLAAVLVPEYIDEIPATCADGETPATYTFALPTGDTAATLTSNCS